MSMRTQQSSVGDEVWNALLVEPSGNIGQHQEHIVATAPVPKTRQAMAMISCSEAKGSWRTEFAETWLRQSEST